MQNKKLIVFLSNRKATANIAAKTVKHRLSIITTSSTTTWILSSFMKTKNKTPTKITKV